MIIAKSKMFAALSGGGNYFLFSAGEKYPAKSLHSGALPLMKQDRCFCEAKAIKKAVQPCQAGNILSLKEAESVFGKVILVAFYNQNAIGVRYLEKALQRAGYQVKLIFFKSYHSTKPSLPTEKELALLSHMVREEKPLFVGLSVMSTLYLEAVSLVSRRLRCGKSLVVWGGVYPTMFPERALKEADFVIRGEGEQAIVELCRALEGKLDFSEVGNLVYRREEQVMKNSLYPLTENLDVLSYPSIGGRNKITIDKDKISAGDPAVRGLGYETAASRGCPYVCSYCCAVSLKRIHKGKYVRLRSVDHVIEELLTAKERMKHFYYIHFWDEIFSEDLDWVREFSEKYRRKIGLPFIIWAHPLKVNQEALSILVNAGLYEVIMGIQSGSKRIRKEIFHRTETDEQIIMASRLIRQAGVPYVCYDFMLQHPFENEEDIKATFRLCTRLETPFQLQLHGLNFLPGTDIIKEAEKQGIATEKELEPIMFGSMEKQYGMYWKRNGDKDSKYWYHLIYLLQFPLMRHHAMRLAVRGQKDYAKAQRLYRMAGMFSKYHYFKKKARMLLKGWLHSMIPTVWKQWRID